MEIQPPVERETVLHFLALIAQDLVENPLEMDDREHRLLLVDLVGKMSRINNYELLNLQPTAEEQEVLAGFFNTARLVHPCHAAQIRLGEQKTLLEYLFEKVVEAYQTLIDARRRASYNLLTGIKIRAEMDPSRRLHEKRSRALHYYRQAQNYRSLMDEPTACDLLREATRLDPQPEYLAGLADLLAQRPSRLAEAIDLYKQAISMRPKDAHLALSLANLLETSGQLDQAKRQYLEVLRSSDQHPEAALALRRLEKSTAKKGSRRLTMPSLRNIYASATG